MSVGKGYSTVIGTYALQRRELLPTTEDTAVKKTKECNQLKKDQLWKHYGLLINCVIEQPLHISPAFPTFLGPTGALDSS